MLYEQLRIQELCKLPLYADFSQETFDLIVEQAGKLAERTFYPSNKKGTNRAAVSRTGRSRSPESFHEPYRLIGKGDGWRCRTGPKWVARVCRLY